MEMSISQRVLLGAHFVGKLCDQCNPVAGVWVYDHIVELPLGVNEVWHYALEVCAHLNHSNLTVAGPVLVIRIKDHRL